MPQSAQPPARHPYEPPVQYQHQQNQASPQQQHQATTSTADTTVSKLSMAGVQWDMAN
jgi:hypothetical protein